VGFVTEAVKATEMILSTTGAIFRGEVRLPTWIIVRNAFRQQQVNQGEELMRNGDDGAFLPALGNQMLIAEGQPCAFGMGRRASAPSNASWRSNWTACEPFSVSHCKVPNGQAHCPIV
jgi:hypothetical protein